MQHTFSLSDANPRAKAALRGKGRKKRKALDQGDADNTAGGGEPAHLWTPDCHRGAQAYKRVHTDFRIEDPANERVDHGVFKTKWLQIGEAVLPHDTKAQEAIQALAQGPESDVNHSRSKAWIASIPELFGGFQWIDGNLVFATNSLSSLVHRCQRHFHVQGVVEFVGLVTLIQLVIKTDR